MSTATLPTPAPPLSGGPADVIAWQRECLRLNAFEMLGRIWIIVFEAAHGAQVPSRSVGDILGTRIEFYSETGGTVVGPRIAQTASKTLLILDPLVVEEPKGSKQYVVGLPDIPDPTWKPPEPTKRQLTGKHTYQAPKAPMIPQRLVDRKDGWGGRARGQILGRYLVCGPIQQILVRPMDAQSRILPQAMILKCVASTPIAGAQGTVMDMLVDSHTGETFLYGGRFEIDNVG